MKITAQRLALRGWRESDRDAFALMHADPEVMHDLGGAFDRARSDAKFDRYAAAAVSFGYCRWAVEDRSGRFLGYAGLMRSGPNHPLGDHIDIGWRLVRSAWGNGYATEAARAALDDAFARVSLTKVFAYTSPDNIRSQAVMRRLGLKREASLDFTLANGAWEGLVWVARPGD